MLKHFIGIILCLIPSLSFSQEIVSGFFKEIILDERAYNISLGEATEIETLIVKTNDIKDGVYEISVTRIGDHIYKIDYTDLYIEMPYCYEYSYYQDAILKVELYKGIKVGTLTFIDD